MLWQDEQAEQAKLLWQGGDSASVIARTLSRAYPSIPPFTRNSVISKLHRMGVCGSAGSSPRGSNGGVSAAKPRRGARRSESSFCPPKPLPVTPIHEAPLLLPDGRNVELVDLTHDMCRWPIGDPKESDFHFCGLTAKPGRVYCNFHFSVAYQVGSAPFVPRSVREQGTVEAA